MAPFASASDPAGRAAAIGRPLEFGAPAPIFEAMILRRARLADLDLLTYWDRKPHVIAAGGADDGWDWATELALDADWQEMLIAERDGRPIGFLQIIDPAREASHY